MSKMGEIDYENRQTEDGTEGVVDLENKMKEEKKKGWFDRGPSMSEQVVQNRELIRDAVETLKLMNDRLNDAERRLSVLSDRLGFSKEL